MNDNSASWFDDIDFDNFVAIIYIFGNIWSQCDMIMCWQNIFWQSEIFPRFGWIWSIIVFCAVL